MRSSVPQDTVACHYSRPDRVRPKRDLASVPLTAPHLGTSDYHSVSNNAMLSYERLPPIWSFMSPKRVTFGNTIPVALPINVSRGAE